MPDLNPPENETLRPARRSSLARGEGYRACSRHEIIILLVLRTIYRRWGVTHMSHLLTSHSHPLAPRLSIYIFCVVGVVTRPLFFLPNAATSSEVNSDARSDGPEAQA